MKKSEKEGELVASEEALKLLDEVEYEVVVTEKGRRLEVSGSYWKEGGPFGKKEGDDRYGYTGQIVEVQTYEKELLRTALPDLDMIALLRALFFEKE